ncbi:MAG: UvrD-helicase domain-containing protein [Actinomycetes bacterium]
MGVGEAEALLEGLTGPQTSAVLHRGAPLLVVAGAGSGKTRVLTRRIAHLLATGDAAPHEILAITFTNKAAAEMRDRVADLVGPEAKRMWVSTFHSACVRILRSQADRIGYSSSFSIYDAADARRLVELVMADQGLDPKRLAPKAVVSAISNAKSHLQNPKAYAEAGLGDRDPFRSTVAEVYRSYQLRLSNANAMDFDDLIMKVVLLLREHEDVRRGYEERFRHLLVDEYQDTNLAQNQLVMLLGSKHRNVTVVGDADQSIYRFRAADVRNILQFEKTFPDATVVLLEQNFRSTQNILDAANGLIAHNPGRHAKKLFTEGEQGDPITIYKASDEWDEARWVATETGKLHARGVPLSEIAIFYRTNAQSRSLEEQFVRAEIPYLVVGGTRFYDRREVRDALAYLRAAANPSDDLSLRRVLNTPKRKFGETSQKKLFAYAAMKASSLREALRDPEAAGVSGPAARGAASLDLLLTELEELVALASPIEVMEAVVHRTGLAAEIEAERSRGAESAHEAEGRLENLAELISVAEGYETVVAMLEAIAIVADSDDLGDVDERVSFMTMHIAKGLEFDAVFMVGMEHGIFPHFRSLDDPVELEEERRVAYVGVTRARRYLHLSHAWSRSLWGQHQNNIPSQFLSEIPEAITKTVASSNGDSPRTAARDRFIAPSDPDSGRVFGARRPEADIGPVAEPPSTGAEELELIAGDRVSHRRWGEGLVTSVTDAGRDATVTVMFPMVGSKKLLLRMAPIEKVG